MNAAAPSPLLRATEDRTARSSVFDRSLSRGHVFARTVVLYDTHSLSRGHVPTRNVRRSPLLRITPRQLPLGHTFHRNAVQEARVRVTQRGNTNEVGRPSVQRLVIVPAENISRAVEVLVPVLFLRRMRVDLLHRAYQLLLSAIRPLQPRVPA